MFSTQYEYIYIYIYLFIYLLLPPRRDAASQRRPWPTHNWGF